jgi:hypothetical protein
MSNYKLQTALESLQARFAIFDLAGQMRLLDKNQIESYHFGVLKGELSMYQRADAKIKMQRHLEATPIPSKTNKVIEEFWDSPATTVYDSIAFSPIKQPNTTLNLWKGLTVIPAAGDWDVIRNYILKVICNGAPKVFDYLLKFLAHMVQKPEEKPGVMIVLLGGQGTGKGMFFNLLRGIWPSTTLQVSDVDQVIGRFNAQLERNYIVCMDEALFVGDKKAIDRLKSTITETHILIEQKYQPTRSIESVHRFFAASNHRHFASTETDDRRFVYLRVSEEHKQDTQYFKTIADAIKDPSTLAAMLFDLLSTDLSNFNVRLKPRTLESLNQKLLSLDGFERYWYEVLVTGVLNIRYVKESMFMPSPEHWTKAQFISSSHLINNYKGFNTNSDRYRTLQERDIKRELARLCPSAFKDRKVDGKASAKPARGYELPDLATARHEFSMAMGGKVNWD